MEQVTALIRDVALARERFLETLGIPAPEEASFKSDPESWCLVEITEHITLAEQVGINGIWKALIGYRRGAPVWTGEPVHAGKSIEAIIDCTWKDREQVPPVAAPRWGGPIQYWAAALRSCQPVLEELGAALQGVELTKVIYPHPISGPLDASQRLEFLRFHLDRHREQLARVRAHPQFPRSQGAT